KEAHQSSSFPHYLLRRFFFPHRPTPKEVDEAYNQIQLSWFLHSGINDLTPSEKYDLNFNLPTQLQTFHHHSFLLFLSMGWLDVANSPLGLMRLLVTPHVDSEDISQFAFVLFLPTFSSDGTLSYGIVKMIWQANNYTH
ncbi:hypothetical protein VP01_10592g1, partial [Puccinia sorghi]